MRILPDTGLRPAFSSLDLQDELHDFQTQVIYENVGSFREYQFQGGSSRALGQMWGSVLLHWPSGHCGVHRNPAWDNLTESQMWICEKEENVEEAEVWGEKWGRLRSWMGPGSAQVEAWSRACSYQITRWSVGSRALGMSAGQQAHTRADVCLLLNTAEQASAELTARCQVRKLTVTQPLTVCSFCQPPQGHPFHPRSSPSIVC